jgi:ribosomal protein S27E
MMTPDEYNQFKFKTQERFARSGVRCPHCEPEQELVFDNPYQVILTSPPRKTVWCSKCNYRGTIVQ